MKKFLSKRVSTRATGATVFIQAAQIGTVGQVEVDIVEGDKVVITVRREDESWFGNVNVVVV